MEFSLATPDESKKVLSNVNRVKIYLTSGIIEVLEKHQPLIGRIDLNLVEIENTNDTKSEKIKFLLQDGMVIVATEGLETINSNQTNSGVYIFAKRSVELNSSIDNDGLMKKIEKNSLQLGIEKEKLRASESGLGGDIETISQSMRSQLFMLEEELAFDRKLASLLTKDFKF